MTMSSTSSRPLTGMPASEPRSVSWPSGVLGVVVDRRGDLLPLTVMRMVFGVIVIRHLWPDLTADVLPVERFHVVWWSWLPEPSPAAYRALTVLGVVAGAVMAGGAAAGLRRPGSAVAVVTRAASAIAFAMVTYLLFVDMTGFAHNRGFLVWMLFGLVLVPAGEWRTRPLWAVTLLQLIVSSVYLTSGGTKLLDPDWRSGLVLWDRVNRYAHLIPFDGLVADVLTTRAFHHVLAPAAIAVELFLAVGLWNRRTRLVAVWVAILFHGSIELAASVETFSYSAMAALLIWVTPRTRDRTVTTSAAWLRGVVRWLDWLGRFRVVETDASEIDAIDADPARGDPSTTTVMIDRDGTKRIGADATLTVLSRLPLLFVITAPLLAAVRLRNGEALAR